MASRVAIAPSGAVTRRVATRPGSPRTAGAARTAIGDAAPVLIGIIPFGIAIGVAVADSSVHDGAGWAASLLLFSASAHMAAVSILAAGGGAVAVMVSVFLINARLLVYSALLAPTFRTQPAWFRWFAPYFVLDQSYALVANRLEEGYGADWIRAYYVAMGVGILLVWPVAVAAGVLAGPLIPLEWELNLAAPLLLVGLLASAVKSRTAVVVGVVAASVALIARALPAGTGLLVATAIGTAAGTWLERRSQ